MCYCSNNTYDRNNKNISITMETSTKIKMVPGQIYFISFGGNTQLVVRYKGEDTMQYVFFSAVHYWNAYESFDKSNYCVKSGITEIREATKPEQYTLFRYEVKDLPINN